MTLIIITKTTTIESGGSRDNSRENHLGWVHTCHMGANQKKDLNFQSKWNMLIFPLIFTLFPIFFYKWKITLGLLLRSKYPIWKKNGNRKVYGNLKLRQIPPQKQPEMFCAVFLWDMSSQPQQSTRTNCYSSLEYREFLQQNSIQRILVFPYNPSSNGLAENYCPTSKYVVKSSAADTAEDF